MMNEEDEAWAEIEKRQSTGWRKKQIANQKEARERASITQDMISAMALQAGWPDSLSAPSIMAKLTQFACVVAAYEREACALICDKNSQSTSAEEIRARG